MEFKKYNSIENSYQEEYISAIIDQGHGEAICVVQEKVHGANLSFITNGREVLTAKRTELVTDAEQFYNSKAVAEKYEPKVISLFTELSASHSATTVTVFGELFGGGYPHPDVPADPTAKLVQRGIYYSPANDFFAFDILIDNTYYLDADTATQLFEQFGFHYAKALFRGTLKDCLSFPNDEKSTVPEALGLPPLEGNIAEGVVIKPVQPTFLRNGDRVIIKNKNELWAENNRFIDPAALKKLLRDGEDLSDEAVLLCEEIYKLITVNRLNNVISKIGVIDPRKDLGRITGLFNKDALADFFKTHQQQYDALEKVESKAVNRFLNKHATELIVEQLGV